LADRLANRLGESCPLLHVATHGGDSQQFALRLLQQIRQGDGIVDIAPDIGVE